MLMLQNEPLLPGTEGRICTSVPPFPYACCQQMCGSLPERLQGQQSHVSWVRRDLQALEYNSFLPDILNNPS